MASNLIPIASNLVAMASNLVAMASNLINTDRLQPSIDSLQPNSNGPPIQAVPMELECTKQGAPPVRNSRREAGVQNK